MSTAHIIGGGPSAKGLDFSKLRGTVIGVNDSFFNTRCDYVVSIDGRWMRHRWDKLNACDAPGWLRRDSFEKHVGLQRAWPSLTLGDCKVFENGTGPGLHCLHGNNSGLVALNYSYWMGHRKIFLYGFDMGFMGTQKHWYPDYEWAAKGAHMYPAFIDQFKGVAKILEEDGIEVFNVSPGSKLECFKKVTYGQAQDYQ
jgi:hypothetical protein